MQRNSRWYTGPQKGTNPTMRPTNGYAGRPLPQYRPPLAQQPQPVNWGAVAQGISLVAAAFLALPRNSTGTPMAQQTKWGTLREVARWGARGYLGLKLLEPVLAPMLAEMEAASSSIQQTNQLPVPPAAPQPNVLPSLSEQDRAQIDIAIARAFEQIQPKPTSNSEAPQNIYAPAADVQWLKLAPHPSVILVLGKRGSGKSALGYRLLELFRNQSAPYVVGFPQASRKLLPEWIGCANTLEDVPPKAVVLLDESYIRYHARDSMGTEGRSIGQLVNLSRQRAHTLIFIVQEARQLDINAISQADVIAVKELSEISREFERRELRRFTDKASTAFAGLKGNRQRWTWVYSEAVGDAGLVENELASFWKPALSRAFSQGTTQEKDSNGTGQRRGAKTPRDDLKGQAKALRQQNHSFGDIGKILGISKTLAWKLVNKTDSRLIHASGGDGGGSGVHYLQLPLVLRLPGES